MRTSAPYPIRWDTSKSPHQKYQIKIYELNVKKFEKYQSKLETCKIKVRNQGYIQNGSGQTCKAVLWKTIRTEPTQRDRNSQSEKQCYTHRPKS